MARILDVLPARIRFSSAVDAPSTRNILIRNISEATQLVDVGLPKSPFSICRGAERLNGPVQLAPEEALHLQVAVDRNKSSLSQNPICDAIVCRMELCRPVFIDLVFASPDIRDDALQQPISDCREALTVTTKSHHRVSLAPSSKTTNDEVSYVVAASSRPSPSCSSTMLPHVSALLPSPLPSAREELEKDQSYAASALSAFLGEAPAPSALRCSSTMSPHVAPLLPASSSSVSEGFGKDQRDAAVSALSAFLGEAPAPAALRRPSPACGTSRAPRASCIDASNRSASRQRRRRIESPPDSPDVGIRDDFDDRPPTPPPAEFAGEVEDCSLHKSRRQASASPSPQVCQSYQTSLAHRSQHHLRDHAFGAPSSGRSSTTARDMAGTKCIPPPMPSKPSQIQSKVNNSFNVSTIDGSRSLSETSQKLAAKQRSATSKSLPPLASREKLPEGELFFVEGVGWCDLFGRQVDATEGEATIRPLAEPMPRSKPRARSKPPRGLVAVPDVNSGPRQRSTCNLRSVQTNVRLTAREQDLNWEALGGI